MKFENRQSIICEMIENATSREIGFDKMSLTRHPSHSKTKHSGVKTPEGIGKPGRPDPRLNFDLLSDDTLLDQREVAAILGLSPWTVQVWRARRRGPAYIRLGDRLPRYRVGDVRTWLAVQQSSHG